MKTRASGPGDNPGFLLTLACAALLLAAGLFFSIAKYVVTGDPLVLLDVRIATWLHTHRSPALTYFFLAVTHLHALAAIGIYACVLAAFLAWKRELDWLLAVGLVVPLGIGINTLLKLAYQRSRPTFDDSLLTLSTYSFPSGHTAGAVLFYGVLAAFLMPRLKSRRARAGCVLVAVLLVALVGFSRMYLGVHFLSDVLAAASASTAWLALCLITVHALKQRRAA